MGGLNLVSYFFYFFQKTIADFYSIAVFQRVIGAIDGSLIAIKGSDNEEHLYVCHKGFHAINVMAVCNAQPLQFFWVNGTVLFMIQQFFTQVPCKWTWKMEGVEMGGS